MTVPRAPPRSSPATTHALRCIGSDFKRVLRRGLQIGRCQLPGSMGSRCSTRRFQPQENKARVYRGQDTSRQNRGANGGPAGWNTPPTGRPGRLSRRAQDATLTPFWSSCKVVRWSDLPGSRGEGRIRQMKEDPMIDKRNALRLTMAVALTVLGASLGGAALAQQKVMLKASDVHPDGYPTVAAIASMGKKLEAATSGRISVQMYPSMQLGGEKEAIEQAQVGALQLAR